MDRVEDESGWLFCPGFADELVGCEAFEGLEASGVVVGLDEVVEVGSQLVVGFVVVALDGGVFEGSVHPLDLAVGPGVLRFGQAMIDAALGAGILKGVCPDRLSGVDGRLDIGGGRAGVPGRGEVSAVIGEHRVHPVGHGGDEMAQEVGGGAARDLLVQFDNGELGCPVDRHQQVKLALFGAHFGDVDVKVADRVGFELALGRSLAFDVRQLRDAVPPQAAMQGGAAEVWDGGLQGIETVVEWQQRVPAEGDDDRLLGNRQHG